MLPASTRACAFGSDARRCTAGCMKNAKSAPSTTNNDEGTISHIGRMAPSESHSAIPVSKIAMAEKRKNVSTVSKAGDRARNGNTASVRPTRRRGHAGGKIRRRHFIDIGRQASTQAVNERGIAAGHQQRGKRPSARLYHLMERDDGGRNILETFCLMLNVRMRRPRGEYSCTFPVGWADAVWQSAT